MPSRLQAWPGGSLLGLCSRPFKRGKLQPEAQKQGAKLVGKGGGHGGVARKAQKMTKKDSFHEKTPAFWTLFNAIFMIFPISPGAKRLKR